MKNRILATGLFTLFFAITLQSQYLDAPNDKTSKIFLTGSLINDFVMQANQIQGFDSSNNKSDIVVEKKYSPFTAGLYSAVIPGAGQLYTKSYWQSASFFGAEVLAWVVYTVYEKKGDRQTNAFQQYADQHWSVVTYANWINANFGTSIPISILIMVLNPGSKSIGLIYIMQKKV